MRRKTPVFERLINNSEDDGLGCRVWSGSKRSGYGCIEINGVNKKAHRVSYETFIGPIPEGLVIDHLCRNPGCIKPSHLEPVTNRTNVVRGLAPYINRRRAAAQTHCVNGHLYDEANTYHGKGPKSGRVCRICANNRTLRRRAEHGDALRAYDRYRHSVRKRLKERSTCPTS